MATALADLPADHDAAHLDAALRYVRGRGVAVDGGAHVGHWTRRLAREFATVIAFEPCVPNFMELPVLPNVMRINAALGRSHGRAGLVPGPENTGQWHLAPGSTTLVVGLDQTAPAQLDFLKLDVEGMEAQALQGAAATIARCRPVVLIEENGLCERYGQRRNTAGRLLRRWGYRLAQRLNKDEIWVWTP